MIPACLRWWSYALVVALLALAQGSLARAAEVLRVGYFPNVTHAQGVIGAAASLEGEGWFEARLGAGVKIEWYAFNAGPSAMEAIFAGSIDLTYVGPNPALNAYVRSRGDEIRLLAGAARGGAALVVRADGGIKAPGDFKGRRVGTPQLGNTQDVAARAWLRAQGLRVTATGGDVFVVPTANADQLSLFAAGRIDAVWTVEPWVSRLVLDGGGVVYLEQPDAVTTVLASSVRLLRERPALAEAFAAAHAELTAWIVAEPATARERVRAALSAAARREMPAAWITSAWPRLNFTSELAPSELEQFVSDAQAVGFLRNAIPLDRLFSRAP